ncbi:unnamed protein product [Haemonchus placei]|uniref:DUF294_C domain-containing protein n=1 Tax=Haemonchus placei TaxID=6290 RepID=A0A0N4W2D9_HAEPC|nr:unnamed protein product [Haemonchus placei]
MHTSEDQWLPGRLASLVEAVSPPRQAHAAKLFFMFTETALRAMATSAGEKPPVAMPGKLIEPMERAHAWAGRQLNKAQRIIRELSLSHADPKDITLQ